MLSSIKEYLPRPPTPGSIWSTLGLPSRGTPLHDLIHLGLPFEYLNLKHSAGRAKGHFSGHRRIPCIIGAYSKNRPLEHRRKRALGRIDCCLWASSVLVRRRRVRCDEMDVLAGSWTWFEASNRHVVHEGGNERCPRSYRSSGKGSARLNFVTCGSTWCWLL